MNSEKLKKFYIRGIKIIIFIIPFIPLLVSWSFIFPYIEAKNYAFRILVEIAAALWLGLIVLSKDLRPKNTPLTLSILCFVFIVGIADILGVNPYKSFWSDYERMEGYITILHLALYFIILKSVFRNHKDWNTYFILILTAGVCVSSHALYHKLVQGYEYREYGTIGSPAFLSTYMLITMFVGLKLLVSSRNVFLRYFSVSAVLLNVLIIYYTATRGAIIALLIGVIFFSLFYIFGKAYTRKDRLYRKAAILVVIICMLVPFILLVFYQPPTAPLLFKEKDFVEYRETLPRLATAAMDQSVSYRLYAWNVAWEGFKERPLLGWGQENFVSTYIHYPPPFGKAVYLTRPHNIILHWLVDAGILGLISYLSIFGFSLYLVRKSFRRDLIKKSEALILVTAFFTYFVQNLSIFDTISSYIVFFTFLAYIDNIGFHEGQSSFEKAPESKQLKMKSVRVVVIYLIVFSVSAYPLHYKPMMESHLANRILYSFENNKYKSFLTVLEDYRKALSYRTYGDTSVRQYMISVSRSILNLKLFNLEGAIKFMQTTAAELLKVIDADPLNLENWMTVIKYYHNLAIYDPSYIKMAERLVKECMRLSPENQWIHFALADNFALKKEYEKALVTVQKAVAFDSNNDLMQVKLALFGILASREDVLNDALESVKEIRLSKDNYVASGIKPVFSESELIMFAQTSRQVKNHGLALKFYKDLISVAPGRAEYHFHIAEIYSDLGEKDNAVRDAEKAANLDPEKFSGRAKEIIDSLK